MKIGFIGLGIMGSRMAANLLRNGHALLVYNRSQEKAAPLLAAGATWAESPAALAGQVELLITMLAHPEAVEAAALGADGFLDHLPPHALWLDCSTVNPAFSRRMAAAATERGQRFLDAPVAGSKAPAEAGTLTFIVGGDKADVDACQPLFDIMGSRTLHVGGHGMGTSLKIVVNLLLASAMASFAEALALGQALGISQEALFTALLGGPVTAPFVTGKRAKIESNDYAPDFPLRWMQKDLHMAALAAYDAGTALPLGNAAKETYQLAINAGLGEADFSAIYRFLSERADDQ